MLNIVYNEDHVEVTNHFYMSGENWKFGDGNRDEAFEEIPALSDNNIIKDAFSSSKYKEIVDEIFTKKTYVEINNNFANMENGAILALRNIDTAMDCIKKGLSADTFVYLVIKKEILFFNGKTIGVSDATIRRNDLKIEKGKNISTYLTKKLLDYNHELYLSIFDVFKYILRRIYSLRRIPSLDSLGD